MKTLIRFILLVSSAANCGEWVTGQVYVRDDHPKAPIAIFINSYTSYGPMNGSWQQLNVSALGIPSEAKAVFLSGLLIITHGTMAESCDLTISFRAPGNDLDAGNYMGQTVETAIGGGQRSTMATWTPIKDGKIEFQWNRSTFGQWPTSCSYGINLSAQSFLL